MISDAGNSVSTSTSSITPPPPPRQVQGQGQAQAQVVRRRREERYDSNSNSNSNKLPRCQPFPLKVPSSVPYDVHSSPQIVIAHRGASAHLPEHSLPAYRLALELGADYIEPDLVSTKDHHLIAMHSLDLSVTTNVVEVFGSSKNKTLSRYIQGINNNNNNNGDDDDDDDDDATGYWVYDFTLEELKQLRLIQRLGADGDTSDDRSTVFDGLFQIPTLTEILELLNEWNENIQPLWYYNNDNGNDNDNSSPIGGGTENLILPPSNNINRKRNDYPPPPRGLYAELKDFPWLLRDANINLLDLFFDHLEVEESIWKKAILRHMCDTKLLREHEYKLPPLIMQSFEAEVLRNFTKRWEDIANANANANANNDIDNDNDIGNNTTTSTSSLLTFEVPIVSSGSDNDNGDITNGTTVSETTTTANIPLPTPPNILLVPHDKCRDEAFWFKMDDSYRDVISGIGPDKKCFFQQQQQHQTTTASPPSSEKGEATFQYLPTVMEHATRLNWVVHPWTERPEEEFFVTTVTTTTGHRKQKRERRRRRRLQSQRQRQQESSKLSPFTTVLEELLFLKCTVGVHGVFSESVDIAVRAMNMPCPINTKLGGSSSSSNTYTPSSGGNTACPTTKGFDTNEIPLGPVILFSFVSGILTALMIWKYCCDLSNNTNTNTNNNTSNDNNTRQRQRRPPRQQGRRQSHRQPHSAVPTDVMDDDGYDDDDDNVVLDERGHEML